MPVELTPAPARTTRPVAPATPPAAGFVVFHPRYERFLRRCGVDSAAAALDLRGEIVCGHPDRHVARVELRAGGATRAVYLKREHAVGVRVRLRNRLDGFGRVSRCEREAATLRRLEAAGLPGPQWLAYGADGTGRAFLLVDEVPNPADLRAALAGGDNALSPAERRLLAERTGRAVAELHDAGFGTPELAAKHLFADPAAGAVTLVDWQSAPPPGPVPDAARARQLAGLHASLAANLADPRERLRFAWAYLRSVRAGRKPAAAPTPRFGAFVREIDRLAGRRGGRASSRDQRQTSGPPTRLVWLAGEAACVVPDLAAEWPTPPVCPPFYPAATPAVPREWVTFPGGRRAQLDRFTSNAPLGRLLAAVRERPWRSPAARAARLLFHLQRYGIDGPKLLAFGQRATGPATADSFVLFQPPPGAVPVAAGLTQWTGDLGGRRKLLRECGRVLRQLHDAGCRLGRRSGEPRLVVWRDGLAGVAVGNPSAVRLAKRLTLAARRRDLRSLLNDELGWPGRADRCRVVRGYLAAEADAGTLRRDAFRTLV